MLYTKYNQQFVIIKLGTLNLLFRTLHCYNRIAKGWYIIQYNYAIFIIAFNELIHLIDPLGFLPHSIICIFYYCITVIIYDKYDWGFYTHIYALPQILYRMNRWHSDTYTILLINLDQLGIDEDIPENDNQSNTCNNNNYLQLNHQTNRDQCRCCR